MRSDKFCAKVILKGLVLRADTGFSLRITSLNRSTSSHKNCSLSRSRY